MREVNHEVTKIIICGHCRGRGLVTKEKLISYHRNEYDYWDEKCPTCNGSGRQKITTKITTTYEPYVAMAYEPVE